MTDKLHVVIVGSFDRALTDWGPHLEEFDRKTMTGTDDKGRTIRFVSVETPDRLRGLRISSFEFDKSAYLGDFRDQRFECRRICEHAVTR